MNKVLVTSLLSAFLTACTVGPDLVRPVLSVQDNFQGTEGYQVTESAALISWKQAYQDPQLQLLIEHVMEKPMDIHSRVILYQSDRDPVVDPCSVDKLFGKISSSDLLKHMLSSSRHGVVFENLDNIHEKICADLVE